jgi:hypothetical protein
MELYPSTEGSFLNCKTVNLFCALAGDKCCCNNKTVLPSLFMVPLTNPYSWQCSTSKPEMRADLVAIGVIKAFHDSASDKVDVPEALLSFFWAPASKKELAWKTIQLRLMTTKAGKATVLDGSKKLLDLPAPR